MSKMKWLLITMCIIYAIQVSAFDFEVNRMYYDIVDSKAKTCKVVAGDLTYRNDIVIPNVVEYDGTSYTVVGIGMAFSGNDRITSITIPPTVTELPSKSFEGCSKLKTLTIQDGVTALKVGSNGTKGEGLFFDCPIETVYLGRNLIYTFNTDYYLFPFYNVRTLNYVTFGENMTFIPELLFYRSGLKKLHIPQNIIEIKRHAFAYCDLLEEIDLGNSIECINACAFNGCTSLKKVVIPNSIDNIETCFIDCSSLEEVVLSNSIKYINRAFIGCEKLTSITVPNSVIEMIHAFVGCKNLRSVNVPENIKDLNHTFEGCESLTELEVPNSVTNMEYAFSGCKKLKKVNISKSATNLSGAFHDCESLENIEIPATVEDMSETFFNCKKLKSVFIPNSVTNMRSTFESCESLTEIEIPNSVTNMDATFVDCINLRKVNISNSVTRLEYTFHGCKSLKKIEIPESIYELGSYCFKGCDSLAVVRINKIKPPFFDYDSSGESNGSFEREHYKNVKIEVPSGSLTNYNSSSWNSFKNIVEFTTTNINGIEADRDNGPKVYYDMLGRKSDVPRRGLNIVNGKKILVK